MNRKYLIYLWLVAGQTLNIIQEIRPQKSIGAQSKFSWFGIALESQIITQGWRWLAKARPLWRVALLGSRRPAASGKINNFHPPYTPRPPHTPHLKNNLCSSTVQNLLLHISFWRNLAFHEPRPLSADFLAAPNSPVPPSRWITLWRIHKTQHQEASRLLKPPNWLPRKPLTATAQLSGKANEYSIAFIVDILIPKQVADRAYAIDDLCSSWCLRFPFCRRQSAVLDCYYWRTGWYALCWSQIQAFFRLPIQLPLCATHSSLQDSHLSPQCRFLGQNLLGYFEG